MKDAQLVIIGAGPAGLAASLYAARARLDAVMVERLSPGGQVLLTDRIENYPGFPDGITGFDLSERLAQQVRQFDVREENGDVERLEILGERGPFELRFAGGGKLVGDAVIVATGARYRRLGVPGEDGLIGKGVSYCATCDGPFFRGQTVAVVGGGDTAAQEALFLASIVEKVYLVHRRDTLRACKVLSERVLANPRIEPVWDTVAERIVGDDSVGGLAVRNVKTGAKGTLPVSGVFVFIGLEPNTGFLGDAVKKDAWGFIVTDDLMETSVSGLFAAGDCRAKLLRQIVTATADGAIAAKAAEHFLSLR